MSRQSTYHRQRRGGYVLVEALIVIAGLVALMAALAADQRASIQATQDRLRQRRAEAAAQSALARALGALQNADANLVTLNDEWAVLGDGGNQEFDLGDGSTFRLEIIDAGSRINVNTATEEHLQILPLSQEQFDALLDWREDGFQERPGGAKDAYYSALPQPYNARLGRLTTLSELLLIRGWTARTLYSPLTEVVSTAAPLTDDETNETLPLAAVLTAVSGSPNTNATGQARTNFGNAAAMNPAALAQNFGIDPAAALQIAGGGPYTSFEQLLGQPGMNTDTMQRLLDAVTFTNGEQIEGKINLNTASLAVLQTLPGITPDIASEIVSRQQAGGFTSLGELVTVPGLAGGGAALGRIADTATVGSDTWIVRGYGESGGVGASIEAVVVVRDGRARVQTWERLSEPGIPQWWLWEEEPTATVDAGAVL